MGTRRYLKAPWTSRLVSYTVVGIASWLVTTGTFTVRVWVFVLFGLAGAVATIGAWRATRHEEEES